MITRAKEKAQKAAEEKKEEEEKKADLISADSDKDSEKSANEAEDSDVWGSEEDEEQEIDNDNGNSNAFEFPNQIAAKLQNSNNVPQYKPEEKKSGKEQKEEKEGKEQKNNYGGKALTATNKQNRPSVYVSYIIPNSAHSSDRYKGQYYATKGVTIYVRKSIHECEEMKHKLSFRDFLKFLQTGGKQGMVEIIK